MDLNPVFWGKISGKKVNSLTAISQGRISPYSVEGYQPQKKNTDKNDNIINDPQLSTFLQPRPGIET